MYETHFRPQHSFGTTVEVSFMCQLGMTIAIAFFGAFPASSCYFNNPSIPEAIKETMDWLISSYTLKAGNVRIIGVP